VPRHNRHALAFNEACGFERTGNESEAYFELALTRERSRNHPGAPAVSRPLSDRDRLTHKTCARATLPIYFMNIA
jgi:hypothetical protein